MEGERGGRKSGRSKVREVAAVAWRGESFASNSEAAAT